MKRDFIHIRAPLFDNCINFVNRKPAIFYCPGHKGGRTLMPEFKDAMAAIDLNNLPDTDTLHCPTQSILQAEKLLADAYDVKHSFMLVGGSTLGNLASIMAVVEPGQKVLVQRNAHKSVIAGIINAGAIPVWLLPVFDRNFLIGHGISVDQLQEAFRCHPEVKGMIFLNPTYFGVVPDIRALISFAHQHHKIVLIDEAHGAHFHFHSAFPLAAEDVGADVVVQSIHKTLSALSQGAALHLNSNRVLETKIRKILQLLQTTSPYFAILASIDLARRQMVLEGHDMLNHLLLLAQEIRERLFDLGVKVLSKQDHLGKNSGFYTLDETKLLIHSERWNLSGYELLSILNKEYQIQAELAGPNYILCILSIGNTQEETNRLYQALSSIKKKKDSAKNVWLKNLNLSLVVSSLPQMAMIPREAFFASSENIILKNCQGRISAEIVTPYPPGIPILMPGELISAEILDFLLTLQKAKTPVSMSDPTCATIQVVK